MTELQLEFIRKFGRNELTEGCWITVDGDIEPVQYESLYLGYSPDEILGHPVQFHDVFARLKEMGWTISIAIQGNQGYTLSVYGVKRQYYYPCNPCLSPMEQPALIEQLLLLIK